MLALLFVAVVTLGNVEDNRQLHRYDVHINAELTRMEVRACFADGLPDRLIANHPLARDATVEFRYLRSGAAVSAQPRSNAILLPTPSDDGCIEWTSDLSVIADAKRMNVGYRTEGSLLLAPGTWFWRPPSLTRNRDIEIRFHLPADMHISVPWELLEAPTAATPVRVPYASETSSTWRFRHGHAPMDWPALMAIGELQSVTFDIAGTPFRLAVTDGPASIDTGKVLNWLQPAADAVSQLWGEFPVDHVQLLAIPVAEGYDAAPWAQTSRGGGAAAHFYVNANASESIFRDDWIATHELVHFALPFIRRSDAWLSEGFASYYQNVLRARGGLITEQQAWKALHDGFIRGNRDTEYDTLREDTLYMHTRGRVMRVYWSGAAMALLADVELRRRSNGEWSLDRVLEEFNRCCRERERTWSAREVFAKFDELADTELFGDLYNTNVYSRHFPRLSETWNALGIETDGAELKLRGDAPLVAIRTAIMKPKKLQPAKTTTPDE